MLGEGMSENYMGEEKPMFSEVPELAYEFDFDVTSLYDEYGEPLFEGEDDNELRNIPEDFLREVLEDRLKSLGLIESFPFNVVVHGESGFDRTGNTGALVFFECKPEKIIIKDTYGKEIKSK
jgi:hypothetical protein